MKTFNPFVLRGIVTAAIALLVITGCSEYDDDPVAAGGGQQVQTLSKDNPGIKRAMEVQERNTQRFMEHANVVGTAVTVTESGEPAVMIMLKEDMPAAAFPKSLDGVPVVINVTGEIVAMRGKPGGGGKPPKTPTVNHRAIQTAPIELGTSGGWRYDLANGYCCAGTLGSLVETDGAQYILSNYHVLEADIVNGGNSRIAMTGDPVIQPGLIDINCNAANAQNVATLVKLSALPGNNVDAAVAQTISNMVDPTGKILEIGELTSAVAAAFINQEVKKSGRTTALSRSKVSGLNATVSITYENECAGSSAFTRTFYGQIIIANKRSRFIAGGDSGSLMVEDVDVNPRPIGLLYAGSSRTAIANPAGDVLSFLSSSAGLGSTVTFVGR